MRVGRRLVTVRYVGIIPFNFCADKPRGKLRPIHKINRRITKSTFVLYKGIPPIHHLGEGSGG